MWLECGAALTNPFFGSNQKLQEIRGKLDVTEIRKVGDFWLTGNEAEAYIPAIGALYRLRRDRAPLKLLTGTVKHHPIVIG